jgi:hypothetical protein
MTAEHDKLNIHTCKQCGHEWLYSNCYRASLAAPDGRQATLEGWA